MIRGIPSLMVARTPSGSTPITFVEGFSEQTAANFANPTTAFNCVAGNLILFATRYGWDGVHTISSVTDTAGNTYHQVAVIGPTNNIDHLEIWYAYNAIANASNQITAHISGTAANVWFGHVQYSGILSSSDPFDQTANGTQAGSATSVTTGAFTTTIAKELIINVATVNATGDTITCTGFIKQAQDTSQVLTFFEEIVSTIQTGATVTTSSNNSRSWDSLVATFKGN